MGVCETRVPDSHGPAGAHGWLASLRPWRPSTSAPGTAVKHGNGPINESASGWLLGPGVFV